MGSVRLDIPVISIDNIGVGVYVEKSVLGDSTLPCYTKSLQFARFVCRFMEDQKKVAISFTAHHEDSTWYLVLLQVEYTSFMNAFDRKTFAVDFQLINRNITESNIGIIQYQQKPQLLGNHLYPNKVSDGVSVHFFGSIFCAYSKGQPIKTLPLLADLSYSLNYNAEE